MIGPGRSMHHTKCHAIGFSLHWRSAYFSIHCFIYCQIINNISSNKPSKNTKLTIVLDFLFLTMCVEFCYSAQLTRYKGKKDTTVS